MIHLTGIHVFYLIFVIVIIISMVMRKDTAILCTLGIFFLGLLATGSFFSAVAAIFESFFYTTHQLLSLILVIAVVVAMTHVLQHSGVNERLVAPFTVLIRSPKRGFWMIGLTICLFSLFFWPSPAVALIGAFLLPAAMRVGIPPLVVAIALNLFGHGIALSGDYVIQGTPKLTANAAQISIDEVMLASLPLVLVMGLVTTGVAYWLIQRDMKRGIITNHTGSVFRESSSESEILLKTLSHRVRTGLALLIAAVFMLNVWAMFAYQLQGDEATALIMGTSMLILIIVNVACDAKQAWQDTTRHLIQGFQFAFRIFTPVIPIASFFYLGGSLYFELFDDRLSSGSQGIIYDVGVMISQSVAVIPEVGVLLVATIGTVSSLDGSGYSGIALIGQISHLFAGDMTAGVATLSAFGQVVSIWIGGGTIVPWALLPAAAICHVDPLEVARRNLLPVVIGLIVTALVTMAWLRFLG